MQVTTSRAKETESISFRIDQETLNKVRRTADENRLSINTLVNQILQDHIEWHSVAPDAAPMPIMKAPLTAFLEFIPDEALIEIAKKIAYVSWKEFILMSKGEFTLESSLGTLETMLRIGRHAIKHEERNSMHIYAIQHNMGGKWSIYLRTIIEQWFEELSVRKFESTVTPNAVHFRIYV